MMALQMSICRCFAAGPGVLCHSGASGPQSAHCVCYHFLPSEHVRRCSFFWNLS
jgi:hypothetical protein